MRKVRIRDEVFCTAPLAKGDVKPGTVLYSIMGRKAMRVVCLDSGDAILRNVRHPDLLEAEPLELVSQYYELLEPLPE